MVQGESWRTDERFKAVAPMYTTLPSRGGDTQFADMYATCDDLPAQTKRRIQDFRVVHRYDSSRKRGRVVALSATEASTLPEVAHPLVQVHPESGHKGLYSNPNRVEVIVGMPQEESERLLDSLFENVTQPKYQYRHTWRDGDIVIWNDRCTMHKANADIPSGERRLMHRMVIAGYGSGPSLSFRRHALQVEQPVASPR